MRYPIFIKREESDEHPSAFVQNETEHDAQLKGWGKPGLDLEKTEPSDDGETVESLRAKLDAKGIEYSPRAGVKRLTELLEEAE
jgi:hypothetical protein